MNVVGHQAEAPAFNARGPAVFGKQADIQRIVGIIMKHAHAAIAALGDVVGQAGNNKAGNAGHGGRLAQGGGDVN